MLNVDELISNPMLRGNSISLRLMKILMLVTTCKCITVPEITAGQRPQDKSIIWLKYVYIKYLLQCTSTYYLTLLHVQKIYTIVYFQV